MINFEPFGLRTHGASAALLRVDRFNVSDGERPAVGLDTGSSVRGSNASQGFGALWIFALPFAQKGLHLVSIVLSPSRYIRAVFLWILASPLACFGGGVIRRIAFYPTLGTGNSAFHADAIRRPSLVVSLWAWLAAVVAFAAVSRGNPVRMVAGAPFAGKANSLFPVALDAIAGSGPAFRKMSVSARLAGIVDALTGGFRGSAFRDGSHTFTVMRPI